MPAGRQVFHGIPFVVIDPAANGRRAAIGLKAHEAYAAERRIAVGRKAASIYFLHTDSRGQGLVGTIRLRYADGEVRTQCVMHDRQVGPWWQPNDPPHDAHHPPVCKVAWRGANKRFKDVGVYAYGLDNPRPDAEIAEIVLEASQNGSFWGVLAVTLCDERVFFMPSDVSYGIPDNWGAGAVVYALIEGLAGIRDAGVAFDRVTLAPRWEAAGVRKATACAKYEASGGYLRYRYAFAPRGKRLTLEFTGSGAEFELAILLPRGLRPGAATLNGRAVAVATRRVEGSAYACLDVCGVRAHKLQLTLK
jgi:hypothetical protein